MIILMAVMGVMLIIVGFAAIFLLNKGSEMQIMGVFWLLFGVFMIVRAIQLRKKKE